MVILGIILLLPGLCAVVYIGAAVLGPSSLFGYPLVNLLWIVWILCLVVGFGGIMLLRQAFRSPRP
jgi:hypothetical protein